MTRTLLPLLAAACFAGCAANPTQMATATQPEIYTRTCTGGAQRCAAMSAEQYRALVPVGAEIAPAPRRRRQ